MASASEGESTAAAEQEDTSPKEEEGTGSGAQPQDTGSAQDAEDTDAEKRQDDEGGEGSDDDEDGDGGLSSGRSIAKAIDDVSSLPGETVNDQDGRKIGEVKEIYGIGDDETPMWVTIESATGLGRTRDVFVPLARIKRQADEIRVPYSFDHIHESPEVDAEDEISEEDDRALRVYYAIGLADQELVQSARSYASQVPEGEGGASKIEGDAAQGPAREIDDTPPAERAAKAYEEQKEEEGEEHRKGKDTTADEIFEEEGDDDEKKSDDGEEEPKGESGESSKDEDEKDSGDESEEKES